MKKIDLGNNSYIIIGDIPNDIMKGVRYEKLWNLHPENKGKIKIAGKEIETPRFQQSYMKPYYFSGMMHEALELPNEFIPFLDFSNEILNKTTKNNNIKEFNQCLINWYENGLHYIGKHSDDETQLVNGSPIMSISLGESRKFRIRDKKSGEKVLDIDTGDKKYIMMCGCMQKYFTHEIVKINGAKGESTGSRINITFRVFK